MSTIKTNAASSAPRDIEKVIESIRLGNIEKEIRSNTARLDVRKVYPVAEVVNPRAVEREVAKTKKVLSRRANANNEGDIRVQGALARAKLEEQGVTVKHAHDAFEHEEMIWKNKAHSSNYLVKRRFDDPELHAFAKSLPPPERKQFEHLSKENLYRLSQDMRDSFSASKKDMDRIGIFHPEVNAHRASSQYLIKLYREINTDNVEDAALKKMQAEKRAKELEDEELRETMKGSDGQNKSRRASMKRRGLTSTHLPSSSRAASSSARRPSSAGHSRPTSTPGSRPGTAKGKKAVSSAAGSAVVPETPVVAGPEAGGLSSAVAAGGLFKSKYKAAGAGDPRTILEEENARLQKSNASTERRYAAGGDSKYRVTTLEDRASEALLKPLKANQVATAAGVRKHPTNIRTPMDQPENDTKSSADDQAERDQVWKEIVALNESLPKLTAEKVISKAEYGYIYSKPGTVPEQIMTFDDFQAIFEQHNQTTNGAISELKRLETDAAQKAAEAQLAQSKSSRPGLHRPGSTISASASEVTSSPIKREPAVAEPVNTVETMMGTNNQFKAFRELQLREKEFALQEAIKKRKESGNMRLSEKANRRTSRLGVKAVLDVMDGTRGEGKGFINVFGDPQFRRDEEVADRSELLRAGGISGCYDEHGHRLAKNNPSMGPRTMSRMGSKLPFYSTAEIRKMNAYTDTNTNTDDHSETTMNDASDTDDVAGEICCTLGRTAGNYPPLGPLTDETKSPLKKKDSLGDAVQNTLIKVWDILNTSTTRRVEFMAKYSTQSYFSTLHDAVNLWARCAIYSTARQALITVCRNIQKNENIPVSTNSFLGIIDEVLDGTVSIPMLPNPKKDGANSAAEQYLQRRRSTFVRMAKVPDIKTSLRTVFTSSLFLEHFNATSSVLDMKAAEEAEKSATAESESMEAAKDKATAFFKSIQQHIDSNLISLTTEALVDLDDVIPHGSDSCRDWVAHTKYPALTKKKKKKVVVDPTLNTEQRATMTELMTDDDKGRSFSDGDGSQQNTPINQNEEGLLARASTPAMLLMS